MSGARAMDAAARACLALALLALAGTTLTWVAQRPAFEFRRIEVRGSAGELQHVSAAAVRAAIVGRLSGNFFTMRLDEARRVFETLPWVAGASVRRIWPDRLVVTLTEHRALGLWSDGRLLSDAGVLFVANSAEAEIYGPLVEFDGPPALAQEAARRFYEFAGALATLQIELAAVDVSERAAWSLLTTEGQRILLGRDDPPGALRARLELIAAAWPQMVARFNGPPARVDARYPNGLAAAPTALQKKS